MIFNKYNNYKEFSDERIDLKQLIKLIKENPLKEKILELRGLEYKSVEYNNLKSRLTSITPHGIFNDSKKESIQSLSGYLYFDIDGFDNTTQLDAEIINLNNTFSLTFICKSCGGRGLAFLIKVNETTVDNFESVHAFIRAEFCKKGYNIDSAAGGLIRKWIISYDPDILYNEDAEYVLDIENYKKFVEKRNVSVVKKAVGVELNPPIENVMDVIPFNELCKVIKTESEYKGKIAGVFVIEDIEYYKILYPKVIKDGNKHKTYIRIINALHYLNNDITHQQVFSYLYYVNNLASPKMDIWILRKLVTNFCNQIKRDGILKIKLRIKSIHFNPDLNLSIREKQSLGATINAARRKNKTIESICTMRKLLQERGLAPSQKAVAAELGLSLSTIKKYWNSTKTELLEIYPQVKPKDIKPDRYSELDFIEDHYLSDDNWNSTDDFFDDL